MPSTYAHLNLTVPHILFSTFLSLLAYYRTSPWIFLGFVALALYAAHFEAQEKNVHSEQVESAKAQQTQTAQSYSEPEFVNHAIEALWPMINQDLLVPVLDLLEDTLQSECPPVVHSVRVESLSLGKKPMKVKWMRPLSDQEWGEGMGGASPGDRANQQGMLGDEDISAGDYVNFEVSFDIESLTDKPTDKAGILVYLGVGVRGLAGIEMPVWIDLLHITGIMRLRILLDPSPPFVRTGTFYFPDLPLIEIAASPLKRSGLGSMNVIKVVPGLRSYILTCIKRVAKQFVKPECFTMDIDRLLNGGVAIRTQHIGVLLIKIHGAQDLRAADQNGKSDPYVAIAWGKQLNKPLFSTRTMLKTLNPVWEETTIILVPGDAVNSGENLVLQLYDSDKFSADDSLGVVERDLNELVDRGNELHTDHGSGVDPHTLDYDSTPLKSAKHKSSQRPQGVLNWSVRFYPLATFKDPSLAHGDSTNDSAEATGDQAMSVEELAGEHLGDKEEGREQGKDGMLTAWPLIHLGTPLKEVEWANWAVWMLTPEPFEWERERLDRRKQAVRWIMGSRDRELMETKQKLGKFRSGILRFNIVQLHDLAVKPSSGEFSKSARSSAGGKPALADQLDTGLDLEEPVSSYAEVLLNDRLIFRTRTKKLNNSPYMNAVSERFIRDWTMERLKIVIRDEREREQDAILGIVDFQTLGQAFADGSEVTKWYPLAGGIGWGALRLSLLWKAVDIDLPKGISGFDIVSTELHSIKAVDLSSISPETIKASSVTFDTESDTQTISSDPTQNEDDGRDSPSAYGWKIPSPPMTLAVLYRQSTSMIIRFSTRSGGLKKKNTTWGIGVLKLGDVPDGVLMNVVIPIFATDQIDEAMLWSSSKEARSQTGRAKEIGVILLAIFLRPGLSKAHHHLLKKDTALALVDEAKQVTAQTGIKQRHIRSVSNYSLKSMEAGPLQRARSPSSSMLADNASEPSVPTPVQSEFPNSEPLEAGSDDEAGGSEEDFYEGNSTRSENRLTHEGKYQYKAVRTARWAKDKVSGKIARMSITKHKRQEGANHTTENETISRL